MFIKLLCTHTSKFDSHYSSNTFTIYEGDAVNAFITREGVRFEYEENHYSPPYCFEDIAQSFISAFDEESYNKIYQKVSNCKMYFGDGAAVELGDVTMKVRG